MKRALTVLVAVFLGCTASEAPKVAPPPVIVFDWLRNGNRDIYRAALDGKDTVRLTSDPGDDQHPTERGGTVVFTSYRDGNGELYAVPSTGGVERRLTTSAANETQPAPGAPVGLLADSSPAVGPSWGPDGTLVAFASTRAGGGGGATNIYTVNVATHEIRQQTYGSVTDGQPAALPDGRIVYVSWVGGTPELRWLDPATQAVVQGSPGPGAAQHPASIY